jgi:hypothetical protein
MPPILRPIPLYRVTLSFHWTKTSSLSLFYLSVMLHLVASPFEPKSKHWIYTITAGHSPQTVWLPPSTAIKLSSQPWSLSRPTTQPYIYFAFTLAIVSRHRSSTCRCHFLSSLSDAYRPSTQWLSHWRTSQPSFASRITYRYVNLCKKIF